MKSLFNAPAGFFSLALTATLLAGCQQTADSIAPTPTTGATTQDIVPIVQIRGINIGEIYTYETNTFQRIKDAGFNTVRIIARPRTDNSGWTHNGGIQGTARMVRDARAQGLGVIVAYYNTDYMAAYNPAANANATQWWLNNLAVLKQAGDFDLNLLNEPHAAGDAATWRNQQTSAITRLRSAGYTGRIIIDAPGYGHETSFVRDEGKNVAPNNTNVVFAIHIYPDSFYSGGLPTSGASDVSFMNALSAAAGRTVMIGEFGDTYTNSSGDHTTRARVQEFVNHAQQSNANCGAIGWAWDGDGHGMNAKSDNDYLNWIKTVAVN